MALWGCEAIDCTLNNVVACQWTFDGEALDSLTVTAAGTDSVLYNRGASVTSVALPMSYWAEADTLTLSVCDAGMWLQSTVIVSKTNVPHHESPDCPATMFHQITGVQWHSDIIDSIVVVRPTVNYLTDENIKVYMRTAD